MSRATSDRRPFVTANFAITADGRVSTRNRTPSDFSSPRDKRRLLEIRATCDAVLASVRTIAADRMTMGLPADDLRTAREAKGKPAYPTRVLLSASGKIEPALPVFAKDFSPIVIFSTTRMKPATRAALEQKATVYLHREKVDLAGMLHTLRREHGIRRVVCEGGPQIFRALLEANLIDELHLTLTPHIFGGTKAPTLSGLAGDFLPRSSRLRLLEMLPVENECFLRYGLAR